MVSNGLDWFGSQIGFKWCGLVWIGLAWSQLPTNVCLGGLADGDVLSSEGRLFSSFVLETGMP